MVRRENANVFYVNPPNSDLKLDITENLTPLSADMALTNGKVLTMNPAQPVAEAIAIKGNKIIKVGTNQEINQLIRGNTKLIHLNGKTVVPGFIDTHIHITDFGRLLEWLNLANIKSITELIENVKKRVEKTPRGRWILGRGWNETRLKENHSPTRLDIDKVSPNNPVVLYHEIAQTCLLNSKALEIANITAKTPAPGNGIIDKDNITGEPTGILRDSATNIVWQKIPEPDENELLEATADACQKIAEAGVTSVHWMVLSPIEILVARKLHAQNRLPIRVNLIIPANLLDTIKNFSSHDNSALHIGGAVISIDGYLASKTAALSQPYSDRQNSKGQLLATPEEINATARKILAAGLQLIIHAMGDRAVDLALTTIETLPDLTSNRNVRIRLEQAALLNPKLIQRIKHQRIIISVQPLVIASEFSVWHAKDHLGAERARWLYPLKTLLKNGIHIVAGSDCPMEPLNPLLGIQATTTREDSKEKVSAEEALRMYTADAAYASGEEKLKGTIKEGKLADLTILSHDPTTTPTNEIKTIKAETTIINGSLA